MNKKYVLGALGIFTLLALTHKSKPAYIPPATSPTGSTSLSPSIMLFDANTTGNYEIYGQDINTGSIHQITSDKRYDSWWAKISPSRTRILFYRTPKGVHDKDYAKTQLWLMNSDGGNQERVIDSGGNGWTVSGHAEWNPSGESMILFGTGQGSEQIFTLSLTSKLATQITHGPGLKVDPSWHPDGQSYIFIYNNQVYSGTIGSTTLTKLTANNYKANNDCYYSPDGSKIAWLVNTTGSVWSIIVMERDGSNPHFIINDGGINSKPQWAYDGQHVYFHKWVSAESGYAIYRIGLDGGGIERITSKSMKNCEYPNL